MAGSPSGASSGTSWSPSKDKEGELSFEGSVLREGEDGLMEKGMAGELHVGIHH